MIQRSGSVAPSRPWRRRHRGLPSATVKPLDGVLVALLIALATVALRLLIAPWLELGFTAAPLVCAVALAAYACGFWPAMLTLVVTGTLLKLLFMGPRGSLFVPGLENRVNLALTWLGCVLVAALFQRLRTLVRELDARGELLRGLLDVQEREKQFLCNEFHDGIVQYAVGARMLLEGLQQTRPEQPAADVVETVIDYLQRGIEDGRRAIRGIRPAVLDDGDLADALTDLVDQFRALGMTVTLDADGIAGQRLPEALQTTLYRVVQEALSNARRHSGSDRAGVSVAVSDRELLVEVTDAGRGFEPGQSPEGFGLRGMAERVRLAGGALAIDTRPRGGTRVAVRVPLPARASDPPPAAVPDGVAGMA